MEKTADKIKKIVAVISALFILWFGLSWAEVITKNGAENPTYSKINAFVLMTENFSK